jgi:hypothetical protein
LSFYIKEDDLQIPAAFARRYFTLQKATNLDKLPTDFSMNQWWLIFAVVAIFGNPALHCIFSKNPICKVAS